MHTTPDTSDLIWRVANKARKLELNECQADRKGNGSIQETMVLRYDINDVDRWLRE